ncbi:MAG: DNA primase [Verrucomicrobiota bacterium]
MGRIAEVSIQQVIAACDIVDIISGYFPLKRSGTTFKANCPFHTEKSPSFHVNPSRGTFHCFGCGEGGNAVGFVMKYESLPFVDTVRKLAVKYGITLIEEAGTPEQEAATGRRVKLLALHREITAWFHKLLLKSPLAADARAYLKSRNLTSGTARNWSIGYAPDDQGYYKEWATEKKYSDDLMIEAGIFSLRDEENPSRGIYARFRHRIMFPIRNDHGDVIAFSGRVLRAEDSPAKYMNSPATPIFNKSEVFFGFDKAKRAIHKAEKAIICEGQIDMLMAFEAGIENIIAPLGTAFTPQHARLLRRHTDQVVLCYDSDNAGYKAAASAFTELSKEGIFVRVAALPPGEDPDSLIRREGVAALRQRLDEARDFFDFQIDLRAAKSDLSDTRERMKVLRELAENLAKLKDRPVLDAALNRCATRLNIGPDEIRKMVQAHLAQQKKYADRAGERGSGASPDTASATAGFEPDPESDDTPPPLHPSVRLLLQLALTDPAAHRWLASGADGPAWAGVSGGDFLTKVLAAPVDPAHPATITSWLSTLTPVESSSLTALLHQNRPASDALTSARHAVASLRIAAVTSGIDLIQNQLRTSKPTPEAVLSLTTRLITLKKELNVLQAKIREAPAEY